MSMLHATPRLGLSLQFSSGRLWISQHLGPILNVYNAQMVTQFIYIIMFSYRIVFY